MQTIEKGALVKFTGFTGSEYPGNGNALVEGEVYPIHDIVPGDPGEEDVYLLQAPNPDFDSSKRKTKNNKEFIMVEVFMDEFEVVEEAAEAVEKGEIEQKDNAVDTIPYADLHKGLSVSAIDENGEIVASGVISRKTKKGVTIVHDGDKRTTVHPDDFQFVAYEEAEEAEELKSESKEKPKAKAKAKTKVGAGHTPEGLKIDEDDPELKDMVILDTDEEDQEIVSMVASSDDICLLAKELSEESASVDYRLGGVLYHVRLSGAYKKLDEAYAGKGGFALYVENELSVGYRKAMYLIDIYAKWNLYHLPIEKVQQIGWTKAQEIARVMSEENAEDLVREAENSTVEELKDTIKESYSGGSKQRESVRRITFKFRLIEESADLVRDFFEQAKAQMAIDDDNEVFEQIVIQWAQDHLNVGKKKSKSSESKRARGTTRKEKERVHEAA